MVPESSPDSLNVSASATKQLKRRSPYRPKVGRTNYLNYGDALQRLALLDGQFSRPFVRKTDVAFGLESGGASDFLREVLATYGGTASRRLRVDDLRLDIARSLRRRDLFERLRCRGFSYDIRRDLTGFPYRLRSKVNLRIALVAQRDLFYPPKVRRFLSRHTHNHYFMDEDPAIAFALGIATKNEWFVLVMQSDLVRRGNAAVREHFRGWRRVLFSELLTMAQRAVPDLYLACEEDVVRACHEDFPRPTNMSPVWEAIYARTAHDFGLSLRVLPHPVNIQLYDRKPPILASTFYQRLI